MQVLALHGNKIGNDGCTALAKAAAGGAMANCKVLGLDRNKIGDKGLEAFAAATKPVSQGGSGALANVTFLYLGNNSIGDEGMIKFSESLAIGAMASLKELYVDDGPLGTEHPTLKAACEARGIALP
jgi:hypothetical protein